MLRQTCSQHFGNYKPDRPEHSTTRTCLKESQDWYDCVVSKVTMGKISQQEIYPGYITVDILITLTYVRVIRVSTVYTLTAKCLAPHKEFSKIIMIYQI